MLGLFGGAMEAAMFIQRREDAETQQEDVQQNNLAMQIHAQNFSRDMASTQYQRGVADMRAAGLNPALAYHQGGAAAPQGAAIGSGGGQIASGGDVAAAMQSAAQVELIHSQTDKTRAEADEVRARTPKHGVEIDKMRQDIAESLERIPRIQQDVRTGAATAAHLEQQVRNLQETMPQIRAATEQLTQLAALNEAQRQQQLTAAGLNMTQVREIEQRLRQDLPALQRALADLERIHMQMQQPGAMADEAARSSFIGQLGAYLKALLPLGGLVGAIPLSRSRTIIHNPPPINIRQTR